MAMDVTMRINKSIKTFLAFHNLQLDILVEGNALGLTPKSTRALLRFLDNERFYVMDSKKPYGVTPQLLKKWTGSKGFQNFLNTYEQLTALISNYLKGFYVQRDLDYLTDLRKNTTGDTHYGAIYIGAKKEKAACDSDVEVFSYKDYKICEYIPSDFCNDNPLLRLLQSVHDSLRGLMVEESFKLKRCALEKCQKVFVISHTNPERHRFCSASHRVTACRDRATKL